VENSFFLFDDDDDSHRTARIARTTELFNLDEHYRHADRTSTTPHARSEEELSSIGQIRLIFWFVERLKFDSSWSTAQQDDTRHSIRMDPRQPSSVRRLFQ
jgi:hypothetical protein